MHVTITFLLRQGQTRASSGPITLPLTLCLQQALFEPMPATLWSVGALSHEK